MASPQLCTLLGGTTVKDTSLRFTRNNVPVVICLCSDARNCMHYISYWGGRNYIAFVGDSRIRQLYFHFAGLLSKDEVQSFKAHSDLRITDEKLRLVVVSLLTVIMSLTWLCS